MQLQPEMPLVALVRLCNSESRAWSRFLVDAGAAMMLASTIVAACIRSSGAARCVLIVCNSTAPS